MFHRSTRLALVAAATLVAGTARAQFVNGSFESGDFTGWVTQDLGDPLTALDVVTAGTGLELGEFEATPTDGSHLVVTGCDGDGPGTIFLAQDVSIPAKSTLLKFDYRAAWDLESFGAAVDRSFAVSIEPSGGGEPLQSTEIRRLFAGEIVDDTGLTTASVDLSAFAGQTVRVKLEWSVPENFTGPAAFVLDDVRLVGKKLPAAEGTSLKARLNFLESDLDTLGFSMVVPVSEEFETLGSDVSITVGDASFDVSLDEKGNGVDDNLKITVRPVGTLHARVTLKCVNGDFLSDLSDYGVDNTTTAPGGVYCSVPVSVELDGTLTERSVPVVFKGVEDSKGSLAGKASSEVRPGKLLANLFFSAPGMDSMLLKGTGVVAPGFEAEGSTVTLTLGTLAREFELDSAGQGSSGDSLLALKRDARDPSLYSVTLVCAGADLVAELEDSGFENATVAKPGADLPLQLVISIDGRTMQSFFVARWVSTEDLFGIAHAKF
jgi:hypothetical protein